VTPIFLIGGATGGIGDPSGKSQERSLLDIKTIEYNQTKIHKSLECIINNIRNY
jgi:tyrosyl-tRNA synthetase